MCTVLQCLSSLLWATSLADSVRLVECSRGLSVLVVISLGTVWHLILKLALVRFTSCVIDRRRKVGCWARWMHLIVLCIRLQLVVRLWLLVRKQCRRGCVEKSCVT